MATRKVARKPATKSASASVPTRAPETKIDAEANTEAIQSKDASNGKPKNTAKVISLQISIGDHDKGRSHEKFVEDILKAVGKVPYGKEGVHASVMGGYYILDGKVCLPDNYNPKTETFKKGTFPPTWAGGPTKKVVSTKESLDKDFENLTKDEYDRKYRLGKYAPKQESSKEHDERMRRQRAEYAKEKAAKEDLEFEEFDWDESDVDNDEKLSAAADASASAAIKKLKSTKKRVVKKAAPKPTAKKVVRRTKK